MASSNKHWPSMFKKSKPSNQNDVNSSLTSTGLQRSPAAAGGDERTPQPKPRWNPKPEQIRILEAIFNSGMVNPPREEIRRIRTQLQEFGQVGDANVFYWFQNRKSRSKNKLRPLQNSQNKNNPEAQQKWASASASLPQMTAPNSSSSSSNSEKSSQNEIMPHMGFSMGFSNVTDGVLNSPTPSVNQLAYFQTHNEINFQLPPPAVAAAEPFSFPVLDNGGQGVVANAMATQGFNYLSEFSNMIQPQPQPQPQQPAVPYTGMSLSDIMNYGTAWMNDQVQDNAMNIMLPQDPQFSFCPTPTTADPTAVPPITYTPTTDPTVVPPFTDTPVTVPPPIPQFQGVGEADGTAAAATCTVFINDVAFEVTAGPFNVREAFGDQVGFVHSSGLPILTDEWGFTLQPLQHGESYYLN